MLSFRALSEKKTKIKINPKQSEITEMENNHGEDCDCMKCEKKRRKEGGEKEVATEAKYYDPMEDPDFDHDEAEATRGQSGKNKSITIKKKTKKTTKTEDVAYVSQEEVSEESNQSIAETETLLTFGQFTEGLTDLQRRRYLGRREGESKERLKRANDRKEKKAALAAMEKQYRGMKSGIYSSYEPEGEQLDEMPYQVYGSPDGKKEKKIGKPVKSKKYADARAAELADTHRATGGQYRSQYVEETELDEATRAAKEGKKDEHRVGVAIRAKQSAVTLAAKRARQKVLDAHEKKTGKKLDISKTPEGKKHDQYFGGSRQTKKVKGEKETDSETHNRRVGRQVSRVVKHGYTSKEKKEVESMAKHTSSRD
ncbi:hypothetical protein RW01021201_184 [Synechococcus phage S-RIM8]|uniref:Gp186 n=2 Tax=Neptunevirus srim18 TaxID=2734121 RepID=A0A1D7SC74_9CAUD|nr:hypothetical protein SXDG_00168 [Synechococcus phage S-RIM8 A.HR1]YP_009783094.1 hypothetical protein HOQ82_gp060 [Synechococcus phage S-RIM8]AFB15445.1 gp186 [Synechococcus phage S-RIM8 A.HR5]AFB17880.1 hypothetical protein SXEG_00086 [Synechococcus phage S-RIM8 A.HR3]AGH57866.1 hypothetical protein CPJG_00114 [Synechococcus phage KBS-M-1A]AFB17670.1 hypothetical protein SXDG_00168 [Synechococcus phage S-RIM8 A.HR1]AOO10332.1 hypothetical protein RW01021201_184 [Synechococcus phage S-RIM8